MRRTLGLATAVVAVGLALTACSTSGGTPASSSSASATAGGGDAFPVTVTHAFGETTIPSQPQRVATVGWGSTESVLALGVVLVGVAAQTYGDDDGDGILPWSEEKITALGGETPTVYDETDGPALETLDGLTPDLILGTYSGLTKEQYDLLSKIAPTVAYPAIAWNTPWRDVITTNAKALGRTADGDALVSDLEKQIADAAGAHPEIAGKTVLFAYLNPADLSSIGFYTPGDARVAYLSDLGLATPESVTTLSEGKTEFYLTQSAEEADAFSDVDVLVTYGDDALVRALQADERYQAIPAVKNGAVVALKDGSPLAAAVSPPTALSLPWSLDEYVGLLADAAAKVK
ncbi:iron-siderophore ABC transporter substrate-binding protein [Cellulomonas massiliensis]|uniref:iron-siderophore ABC transporter substrate-binding protein n=1 Tax=Cellulomonas massiliensis TaxID=1465811 RepID=UPI0002FC58FB|nr:iron-siderophore ABC transporter substrate-binding protein [Cellulomonas massiliensis]